MFRATRPYLAKASLAPPEQKKILTLPNFCLTVAINTFLARLFEEDGELLQSPLRRRCQLGLSFACMAYTQKPFMLLH